MPVSEMLPRASVCGVQPVCRRCALGGGVSDAVQAWVPSRGWDSPGPQPSSVVNIWQKLAGVGDTKTLAWATGNGSC